MTQTQVHATPDLISISINTNDFFGKNLNTELMSIEAKNSIGSSYYMYLDLLINDNSHDQEILDFVSTHSNILGIDLLCGSRANVENLQAHCLGCGIQTTCTYLIEPHDVPALGAEGNPITLY